MAWLVLPLEKSAGMAGRQLQETSSEMSVAFRILREAREHSSTAATLLDSIEKVLRKHKMPTPAASPLPDGGYEGARTCV